jgi:catechol 2,3-dioxygenase-like lactoylglutathione lyase family enzyme
MANLARAASEIRFARQTDRLDELVRFYTDGLGLERIGGFEDHAGYSGVILGVPGRELQLEFISHAEGSPGEAPTEENLLVLYLPDAEARDRAAKRLRALGGAEVAAGNPWWDGLGALTFADPDGWRVVLVPSAWNG